MKKRTKKKPTKASKKFAKFRGWDWTEIISYYDGFESGLQDEEVIARMNELISMAMGNISDTSMKRTPETKKFIRACRLYVKKLGGMSQKMLYVPLWRGLGELHDDWVFLQMLYPLYQYMWT